MKLQQYPKVADASFLIASFKQCWITPWRWSLIVPTKRLRPKAAFGSRSNFGNPLRKAQAAGVDLPQISCIYQQLKFLDEKIRVGIGKTLNSFYSALCQRQDSRITAVVIKHNRINPKGTKKCFRSCLKRVFVRLRVSGKWSLQMSRRPHATDKVMPGIKSTWFR